MKETNITFYRFTEGFNSRKDNFTYEALCALYEHFTDFEKNTGEEIEFDPIAICCDYTEWDNLEEYNNQTGQNVKTLKELARNITVIELSDGSFISSN